MPDSQLITKVNVEEDVKFGLFSNAFRVVEEVGPDCFLDFMVYSVDVQEATVVCRVRVRREFLDSIRKTLSEAIEEFPAEGVSGAEVAALRKSGEPVH